MEIVPAKLASLTVLPATVLTSALQQSMVITFLLTVQEILLGRWFNALLLVLHVLRQLLTVYLVLETMTLRVQNVSERTIFRL